MASKTDQQDAEKFRTKIRNFLHVYELSIKGASVAAGYSETFLLEFLIDRKRTLPFVFLEKLAALVDMPTDWWYSDEPYPARVSAEIGGATLVDILGNVPGKITGTLGKVEANLPPGVAQVSAFSILEDRGYVRRGDIVIAAASGVEPRSGCYCIASKGNERDIGTLTRVSGILSVSPTIDEQVLADFEYCAIVLQVHRASSAGVRLQFVSDQGLGPSDFAKLI